MFSNNVRRAKSVRCVLHSELMELDKKAPETLPRYATPCPMLCLRTPHIVRAVNLQLAARSVQRSTTVQCAALCAT